MKISSQTYLIAFPGFKNLLLKISTDILSCSIDGLDAKPVQEYKADSLLPFSLLLIHPITLFLSLKRAL
jgi:hypothetical protein